MSNTTDLVSLIRSLNHQSELNDKLHHLKEIVEFISTVPIKTVNKDLCQTVLPSIKSVFEEILANNSSLIENGIANDSILDKLRDYLKMCEDVLVIIDEILKYIVKNGVVDLTLVGNVPEEIARLISVTFEHCKKCDNLCDTHAEKLNEIYVLFRKAQETHFLFLKVLEFHTDISFFSEFEILILIEILDILCNISDVLFDMNTKSMICNWKVYNTLIQKYFDELKNHNYGAVSSLKTILVQIQQKLKSVGDMESEDSENIKRSLKVTNFLVNIFIKISNVFCESTPKSHILNFLTTLYGYKIQYAQHKDYLDLLFLIDLFVDKLLEKTFVDVLTTDETSTVLNDAPLGFLVLCNVIFQKIVHYNSMNFLKMLDNIFKCIDKCFEEFLNELVVDETEKLNIYEELLVNVTSFCLFFTNHFKHFERVMLKNVLSGSVFTSLFAIDVWDLFLRNCHPKIRFQTLSNLVDLCEPLLSVGNNQRVEVCFVQNLLQRIFCLLSVEDKIEVIAKFTRKQNTFCKVLSFEQFTVSQRHLIEALVYETFEKIELFENKNISVDDFYNWCDTFGMISNVNFVNLDINVTNYTYSLGKLWNFEKNPIEDVPILLNTFITSLCKITNSLILHFSNPQLLSVLIEMKQLLQNAQTNNLLALNCLRILNTLSKKSLEFSQEYHQITATISDIFVLILNNKNPIIRTDAVNVLENFENSYSYNEVVQKVRNGTKVLKSVDCDLQKLKNYCKNLKFNIFEHRCLTNEDIAPVTKKFKSGNDEINTVIERIKNDVAYLRKTNDYCDFSQKNLQDIVFVINSLQKLQ